MVSADKMSESEAEFELDLQDAESEGQLWESVSTELLNRGVPVEIVARMEQLWERTENLAAKVVRVGRIIILKIIDFLRNNPKVAGSLAVSAAVFVLANAVPIIGQWLAPILALATFPVVLLAGSSVAELQQAALDFFRLVIEVFGLVFLGAK